MLCSSLIVAGLLAACASAVPAPAPQRSAKVQASKGVYTIPNVGTFLNRQTWDFSKLADGSSIPDGLWVSNYQVGDSYTFVPQNSYISGGYLNLKVDGGQKSKPYRSGEVTTTATNIKYASVRTVAIFAEPAGVCNGMFFYRSDNQETDIEWLSDSASKSNNGKRQLWFANQASNSKTQKSVKSVTPPANPTSTEHEYRLDWVAGAVRFFVDGVQIWESKQNVPNLPGPWVFNNWADGDKGWSAGPPATNAIFRIKSIDMYYNTA
ncbi:beta-glucanase [Colletotrichum spaethianum]|uniref:Beta-glucanase n=1 Tax=Colletotrichum spaethianum TaxID=700344 RepID=A0AA37UN89_9PEZI|nr:beta-glucanase [Colletotrichum spaethianum]GKT48030.1 beta-glucanase [Colletotrichum spaethianum]